MVIVYVLILMLSMTMLLKSACVNGHMPMMVLELVRLVKTKPLTLEMVVRLLVCLHSRMMETESVYARVPSLYSRTMNVFVPLKILFLTCLPWHVYAPSLIQMTEQVDVMHAWIQT